MCFDGGPARRVARQKAPVNTSLQLLDPAFAPSALSTSPYPALAGLPYL
jgi:hypothetical protein